MSSEKKNAKLKEKLQKQKEKNLKKIEVLIKEKKRPEVFAPTIKNTAKKNTEEIFIRKYLTAIADDTYSEKDPAYKLFTHENRKLRKEPEKIKTAWDDLDQQTRQDYAFRALKKIQGAPYGRSQFIDNVTRLSPKMQLKFIRDYIARSENHLRFYDDWHRRPDIMNMIREMVDEEDKKIIADADTKGSSDQEAFGILSNAEKIRNDLIEKALKYAEKKGVDVSDIIPENLVPKIIHRKGDEIHQERFATGYYKILSAISPDKKGQEKAHRKIAKTYIDIDVVINSHDREFSENLSIHDLSKRIARKIKILSKQAGQDAVRRLSHMSEEDLNKEAHTDFVPLPTYETLARVIVLYSEVLDNQVEKSTPGPSKTKKVVERNIYGKEQLFLDPEQEKLIEKISKVTGKPKEYYRYWTLEELRQRYQALESGEEYWEEFERETIIDSLVNLTSLKRSAYEKRSTSDLIYELDKLDSIDRKRQRDENVLSNKPVLFRKCIDSFINHKWIDAQVLGVWIASNSSTDSIREYIFPGVTIMAEGFPNTFYRANHKFFALQCNSSADKRIQNDNILTCYKDDQQPINFIVGYVIKDKNKVYKKRSYKIVIGGHEGESLLIQDEDIFYQEQHQKEISRRENMDRVNNILAQKIDHKSVETGAQLLSLALLDIAPDVSDYEANSPYIRIAIDSVKNEDDTNKEFFTMIADTIVYLKLKQADLFQKRVKSEYYLPEVLMSLSPEDKLPEIYGNIAELSSTEEGVKTIDIMTSFIRASKVKIVQDMGYALDLDPSVKIPVRYIPHLAIDIDYDQSGCVNKDEKISKENLTFYRDPEDEKVYCVDISQISERFDLKDFTNPYTGKKFSKEFIQRYTISYFDNVDEKTYTFPFQKLYNQLKKGEIVNKDTSRPFDPKFVQSVLSGTTWEESLYFREKKFKKLDMRLSRCRNPEDVANESVENVIYYRDPVNGVFCFSIEFLSKLISENNERSINPHTGLKFSKKFITRFKRTYNLSLHRGGFNQPEFQKDYRLIVKPVKTTEEQEVQAKTALIIPDLWNLVASSLEMEDAQADEDQAEDAQAEDSQAQVEEDQESESSKSRESESSDSKADDSKADVSKADDSKAEPVVQQEDSQSDSSLFAMSCEKCKKKTGILFKSVVYNGNDCKTVRFCSVKCMEDYDFPTHKKRKN